MTEAAEQSPRDALIAAMHAQAEAEQKAVREFLTFIDSAGSRSFLTKIEDYRGKTLPGSHFEQTFDAILNVIGQTKELAARVIEDADARIAAKKQADEAETARKQVEVNEKPAETKAEEPKAE